MSVFMLVQTMLPLLTNLLGTTGVISPNLSGLIGKLSASVPTLVSALTSGGGVTAEVMAVLQAVQAEIFALKGNNALLTQNQQNEIATLEKAITDALKAFNAARVTDDPSNLTPLPEKF